MTASRSVAGHKENRMDERYNCEALINWSYFNENKYFRAKMLNISRNGVYFETSERIRSNTTIFVRLEALPAEKMQLSEQECLRTASIGEVKWCHELSRDNCRYYGVGVRYCNLK